MACFATMSLEVATRSCRMAPQCERRSTSNKQVTLEQAAAHTRAMQTSLMRHTNALKNSPA